MIYFCYYSLSLSLSLSPPSLSLPLPLFSLSLSLSLLASLLVSNFLFRLLKKNQLRLKLKEQLKKPQKKMR
jgi:hypothetical protein